MRSRSTSLSRSEKHRKRHVSGGSHKDKKRNKGRESKDDKRSRSLSSDNEHREKHKRKRRVADNYSSREKEERGRDDKRRQYSKDKSPRRYDRHRPKEVDGSPSYRYESRTGNERQDYHEDEPNSDTYWNRYPKLKNLEEQHVVGSRYYDYPKEKTATHSEVKSADENKTMEEKETKSAPSAKPASKKNVDPISSKTGGAYIPPAMLKMMQASITDKSSLEFQRISWEALKKSIHGLINKVNRTNIDKIIRQLLKENIVRGRGLLCRSIIQAQTLSPTFTHVYAALAALINSRFPNIGELLLKRLVIQFRRGFRRNDKPTCISAAIFIAHLVNQRVAHEILALEILTLLVETPTDDSIEVAIAFLKECGMKLTEVSKKGIDAIFEMLRHVMNENKVERRVQYMIDVMFQVRKDKFKDNEAISEGLDLVEEEDQFTHLITLDDATDGQDILNVFKMDPDYEAHEEKYQELSKEMVGDSDEDSGSEEDDDDEGSGGEDEKEPGPEKQVIIDNTETNLVALRRTIYLTINSSLDFEECVHKLMRMQLKPGQEPEVCAMVLDCCCEMRTYEKFYGLLAQRLCQVNRAFIGPYENLFKETYATVHRLKKGQCRNVAKLLAHLLFTDAISWDVLSCIRLNEHDTTSSGRIFIKILFLELTEHMGLTKLYDRVKDATMQEAFSGLFPRDNPCNTRFSINFFTSIGLGGLTDQLREHLKTAITAEQTLLPEGIPETLHSSEDTSSSSSEDSSDETSEEDYKPTRHKKEKLRSGKESKKHSTEKKKMKKKKKLSKNH